VRRTALPSAGPVREQDAGSSKGHGDERAQHIAQDLLDDHLAGATGGLALFRRATSSAQGASKAELTGLTQQVTQDRQALLTLMHHLTVPVQHYKVAAGWALEKAGWLKTNGRLLHRSPLSELVELEAPSRPDPVRDDYKR